METASVLDSAVLELSRYVEDATDAKHSRVSAQHVARIKAILKAGQDRIPAVFGMLMQILGCNNAQSRLLALEACCLGVACCPTFALCFGVLRARGFQSIIKQLCSGVT